VCVLASGSKGNSVYIEGGGTRVLVDAGLCGKEITRRLKSVGVEPEKLDAVLVTHGHRDHTSGVGVMSRRYGLPVYSAYRAVRSSEPYWGKIDKIYEIEPAQHFSIKELQFYSFPTSHDAAQSMGFIFKANEKKGGIATDLGFVTRLVRECLKKCHLLVIESNHDDTMLREGPYPWHLKQRIKGKTGHLSNADCGALLSDIFHENLKAVALAHLSEINNHPDRAYNSIVEIMKGRLHREIKLTLASQEKTGEMLQV